MKEGLCLPIKNQFGNEKDELLLWLLLKTTNHSHVLNKSTSSTFSPHFLNFISKQRTQPYMKVVKLVRQMFSHLSFHKILLSNWPEWTNDYLACGPAKSTGVTPEIDHARPLWRVSLSVESLAKYKTVLQNSTVLRVCLRSHPILSI